MELYSERADCPVCGAEYVICNVYSDGADGEERICQRCECIGQKLPTLESSAASNEP